MIDLKNNIQKEKIYRPYIIVDERESTSIKTELEKIGCDLVVQTLDVAGFVVSVVAVIIFILLRKTTHNSIIMNL